MINLPSDNNPIDLTEKEAKNPLHSEQQRNLEKEELAGRIMTSSRNELLLKLRYLDLALGSLPQGTGNVYPAGTDGSAFLYSPGGIIKYYLGGRSFINHLYLHTLFHCILCHPFEKSSREQSLWDLSCDIAAESLVDSLSLKCAHTPASYRKSVYARLKKSVPVLTAEAIYAAIEAMGLNDAELAKWRQSFSFDSHALWEGHNPSSPGADSHNRTKWEDIRERMEAELSMFSRDASHGGGDLLRELSVQKKSRYDYREFLRKFMVIREELKADPDSFDYIFYHYGIKLYGNMPLIEPLETSEIKGIEDFVIVIDTSMSTRGDLVERFLEETFGVLEEEGTFFRNYRIHILQCDEKVQSDTLIKNHDELESYMRRFTLKGGGGTDFRPAFAYVEERIADKSYGTLKGLLYFTDGYGTFPTRMPGFETAFVFFREHYTDVDVPPWAIRLVLDWTDLMKV